MSSTKKGAKVSSTLPTTGQNEKMKLWLTTITAALSLQLHASELKLDNNLAYQLTESLTVEVYDIESGKAMNHFNKKAKGQLVRAALMANMPTETIKDLQKCAAKAGLKVEVSDSLLTLVTRSAT